MIKVGCQLAELDWGGLLDARADTLMLPRKCNPHYGAILFRDDTLHYGTIPFKGRYPGSGTLNKD